MRLSRRLPILLGFPALVLMVLTGLGLFAWHDLPVQTYAEPFLGVDREAWNHVHLLSSFAFAAMVATHLVQNRRGLGRAASG